MAPPVMAFDLLKGPFEGGQLGYRIVVHGQVTKDLITVKRQPQPPTGLLYNMEASNKGTA